MALRAVLTWLNWKPPGGAESVVPQIATDDQTGQPYELVPETRLATFLACVSAVYSMLVVLGLFWLLLDVWSGRDLALKWLGYATPLGANATFRLMAFVAIGGALGGAVDGIRSVISWHSQRGAYGPRFIWKDFALPFMGASVALIAYAVVRGGAGAFSGDISLDPKGGSATVAGFGIAAVAGFCSLQVFRWIDDKGNKIFKVAGDDPTPRTIVPNLNGMTVRQAGAVLAGRHLVLAHAPLNLDVDVTGQMPAAMSVVRRGSEVSVTVGK